MVNRKIAKIRKFNFDDSINAYNLSDDLQQLYDTDLFD